MLDRVNYMCETTCVKIAKAHSDTGKHQLELEHETPCASRER